MSESVNPVSSAESTEAATATSAAAGVKKSAVASTTTFSTMDQLKNSPEGKEFYDGMIQALAQKMCNQFKRQQENLKKMKREYDSLG